MPTPLYCPRLALTAALVALTACVTPERTTAPELTVAERQLARVSELQRTPPADPPGRSAQRVVYDWGVAQPVAWLGAHALGMPLFTLAEAAQLVALPVYWGHQDEFVDTPVEWYRRSLGYHRTYDVLMPADQRDPTAPRPAESYRIPRGTRPDDTP